MKPTPMDAYTVIILIAIGIAAGMLSGLVGVGGGIALVPLLVYFLHYNQHQAQGTSLGVLSFPVVILAFITYYNDCKKTGAPIEFNVIAIIGIGFVAGGLLGSKIAVKIDQELLRKLFAILLFYTGVKMLNWDALIIKWLKGIF
ncbi:MAG TPA: sulfite exporter TauE/SafE family protein [Flavitalea sp.]|nr:sulfite exporter TauE/SafE family protein [Flavitalea sp.]